MKKSVWVTILVLASFLLISGTAGWAASSPKIGYFDLQTVLDKSRSGKEARESFKGEKEKIKNEMEEKGKAFREAKEKFDKKKSVMDESARQKEMKALEEMQREGEKLIMESNTKLNKLSNDLMGPIVNTVLEIVRTMGKDDKYDYIIEVGKGGIVYANDKYDLTKEVTEKLDKTPIKK